MHFPGKRKMLPFLLFVVVRISEDKKVPEKRK